MTSRRTPQVRDYVSFKNDRTHLRDFLHKVAEAEQITISELYILGAASYWKRRHGKTWKRMQREERRDKILR